MRSHDANQIRRWILPAVALLALVAAWIFVSGRFTLADVKLAARALDEIATAHPFAMFLAAMAAQAAGMAFSLPTKALLALLAGALLGPLAGAAATEVGVLSGTTALFFGSRRVLGSSALARPGTLTARLQERLRTRPVLAVAGLRLVITVPYGPITIACAAAGMGYRQFVLGSLLGDLPVTALYAFAGSRLMSLASAGEAISPATCVALAAAGIAMFAAAVAVPIRGRR
jgi:phospholipase D1/2